MSQPEPTPLEKASSLSLKLWSELVDMAQTDHLAYLATADIRAEAEKIHYALSGMVDKVRSTARERERRQRVAASNQSTSQH